MQIATSFHKKVLPEYSHNAFYKIGHSDSFSDFYLAGGTSLALQIGHRESIDLDFFTKVPFRSNLINSLPNQEYTAISLHDNYIELIQDETKISFMYWAFEPTQPLVVIDDIFLANPIDIGLFKLLAIQGRHTRKDIVDLFFIDREIIEIKSLVALFNEKYPKEKVNLIDSAKEIFNIDAINMSPMPKVYEDIEFDEVYEIVKSKVTSAVRELLQ